MKKKYLVISDPNITDPIKPHEKLTAQIVADYFQCNVTFIRPQHGKTPDIQIRGISWEIKSPIGNSKNTIGNNFHSARGQSQYIILSLLRCKMHQSKALARIRSYINSGNHKIKGLLIITKLGNVIDYFNEE